MVPGFSALLTCPPQGTVASGWAGFILVQLWGPEGSRGSDFGSTGRAGLTSGQCSTGQPCVPVPRGAALVLGRNFFGSKPPGRTET